MSDQGRLTSTFASAVDASTSSPHPPIHYVVFVPRSVLMALDCGCTSMIRLGKHLLSPFQDHARHLRCGTVVYIAESSSSIEFAGEVCLNSKGDHCHLVRRVGQWSGMSVLDQRDVAAKPARYSMTADEIQQADQSGRKAIGSWDFSLTWPSDHYYLLPVKSTASVSKDTLTWRTFPALHTLLQHCDTATVTPPSYGTRLLRTIVGHPPQRGETPSIPGGVDGASETLSVCGHTPVDGASETLETVFSHLDAENHPPQHGTTPSIPGGVDCASEKLSEVETEETTFSNAADPVTPVNGSGDGAPSKKKLRTTYSNPNDIRRNLRDFFDEEKNPDGHSGIEKPTVRSLEDYYKWATDDINTLEKMGVPPEFLVDTMMASNASCACSGIMAPETGDQMLAAALEQRLGFPVRAMRVAWACEILPASQREVLDHPSNPARLVANLTEFWTDHARNAQEHLQRLGHPLTLANMMPLVLSNRGITTRVWDLKAKEYFDVVPTAIHRVGLMCQPWTPLGARAKDASHLMGATAAWLGIMRKIKPAVIIIEESHTFNESVLSGGLGDLYSIQSVTRCASRRGPQLRQRYWGVLRCIEKCWNPIAPLSKVLQCFDRQVVCDYTVFMVAGPDTAFSLAHPGQPFDIDFELAEEIEYARGRPKSQAKNMDPDVLSAANNCYQLCLTVKEEEFRQNYIDTLAHPDCSFMISQNCKAEGSDGKVQNRGIFGTPVFLHPIVRNPSLHWNNKPNDGKQTTSQRWFTKGELLLAMGNPLMPQLTNGRRCSSFTPGGMYLLQFSCCVIV